MLYYEIHIYEETAYRFKFVPELYSSLKNIYMSIIYVTHGLSKILRLQQPIKILSRKQKNQFDEHLKLVLSEISINLIINEFRKEFILCSVISFILMKNKKHYSLFIGIQNKKSLYYKLLLFKLNEN
jgi:ABC-type molybdate transport system ATPase subunit